MFLTSFFQDVISLFHCNNLRILHIFLDDLFAYQDNWNILRSVTSLHLEEIHFYGFNAKITEEQSPEDWGEVDDLLCGFYDRSYTGTFNVSLVAKVYTWEDDNESEQDRRRFYNYVLRVWSGFSKKGDVIRVG